MERLRTLGETPEYELYDAAARGDERDLQESVLQKDPQLLDRVSYSCSNKTPLHVATIYGHLPFVKAILNHNPDLAQELDSQQSSALHLASAKGYLEICKELILAAPDMCQSRDCQGRNPLHLAAMKGHVGVLTELVQVAPFAARAKLDGGMTVLHMCVQYRRFEAFAILVHNLNELVNVKDDHGDTILHMAVRDRQIKAIKDLLIVASLEVNALNLNRMTALDVLIQSKRDSRDLEIEESLKSAGGSETLEANMDKLHKMHDEWMHDEWLDKTSSALMVVASLIATMAFQVGVNPPSGVWQEDYYPPNNDTSDVHIAGFSILERNNPSWYNQFSTVNTTGFIASLSIILLLMSGLPLRRRFFVWILMVITWVAITAIAFVYTRSVLFLAPNMSTRTMTQICVYIWIVLMALLLVGHTIRLIVKLKKSNAGTSKSAASTSNTAPSSVLILQIHDGVDSLNRDMKELLAENEAFAARLKKLEGRIKAITRPPLVDGEGGEQSQQSSEQSLEPSI